MVPFEELKQSVNTQKLTRDVELKPADILIHRQGVPDSLCRPLNPVLFTGECKAGFILLKLMQEVLQGQRGCKCCCPETVDAGDIVAGSQRLQSLNVLEDSA